VESSTSLPLRQEVWGERDGRIGKPIFLKAVSSKAPAACSIQGGGRGDPR